MAWFPKPGRLAFFKKPSFFLNGVRVALAKEKGHLRIGPKAVFWENWPGWILFKGLFGKITGVLGIPGWRPG